MRHGARAFSAVLTLVAASVAVSASVPPSAEPAEAATTTERAVAAPGAPASLSTAPAFADESALVERATAVRQRMAAEEAQRRLRAAEAAELARAKRIAEQKARAARAAARDPRALGRMLAAKRGWSGSQWTCLNALWTKESNWKIHADNPTSSAYGIPQALPGSKMSSAGPDWRNNPTTQISWGLGYIADRYGTPCGAWSHSKAHNWY